MQLCQHQFMLRMQSSLLILMVCFIHVAGLNDVCFKAILQNTYTGLPLFQKT